MKILNGLTILLLGFSLVAGADTPVDQLKTVNSDASSMMRALDVLFAREQMKEDATAKIHFAPLMNPAPASDTDHKVDVLTDTGHLDKCQKNYKENDPNANPRVVHLDYGGADCPLAMTGDITINKKDQNDIDVNFLMKVQILSADLQKQFDISEISIPGQAHVTATTANGFEVDTKIRLDGNIKSLKLGLVSYGSDGVMSFTMGNDGMKIASTMTETYKASAVTRVFRQETEGNMTGSTEKYYVDNKEVSKDEFNKDVQTLQFPGFQQDGQPLHPPVNCQVRAYDAKAISIDALRADINNGTADSLTPVETVPPLSLDTTGKVQFPFENNTLQLEVSTTADVIHLDFTNNATQTSVGNVTGLLAEKFDLAKTVGDRHIRLNCAPK